MTDYENDKEEKIEIEELNDSDFANEHKELLVLLRNYCATRRPSTLCSDIKSFIQGVRSAKYATSSLTTEHDINLEHS